MGLNRGRGLEAGGVVYHKPEVLEVMGGGEGFSGQPQRPFGGRIYHMRWQTGNG